MNIIKKVIQDWKDWRWEKLIAESRRLDESNELLEKGLNIFKTVDCAYKVKKAVEGLNRLGYTVTIDN